MASTARCLRALLLFLTLATGLAAGPAAQGQRDYLADWRQRMAEVEDNLRLGHWEPAGESADRLLQEMLPRVRNEGDGPALIATVLYLGAASAAGAGEEESALWRWWLAQNLDPQLRRLPLPDLGAASALLDRHRLRAENAIPQGLPTLPAEWEPTGYRPPLPLRVPYPSGDTSRWSADVGVEFLIDADGSVSQPVLVASGDATLVQVYLQFMALREWRYRPATYRGEPVAVAFTVQSLRTPLSPLDNWVRMDLLREPHDLLADEAWEEAAAQAWDLTRKAGSNFVLIGALSFAAVAEAQLGNRQRALGALRTVESLGGSAYPQLPAYGDGALWLWQQRARCIRAFRWSDIDGEGEPLDEVCTSDPRTDGGFEPPRPLETPWADLAEAVTDEPVFVRLLVDDQGWVSEARMLASGTAETAPTVLAAVQEWRFEAAQRNGEAVPAFYDTVLSPPPVGNGEAVEEWQRRLGAVEKQVSAAEWAVALEAANRLQGDLEADLVRGGAELLGRTLAARALAEAGLATAGDADQRFAADALWHWHAAQSLAPQVGYLDLSRHGAAGALLAPHTPPRPLGAEPYLVSASHEPPRVIERVAPAVGAAGGGLVEIEVSIDAAGRPHTPVWHSGGPSAHLSAAFEALRNWRFEPPAEGAPERHRVVVQASEGEPGSWFSRDQQELMQGFRQWAADEPGRAGCLWTSLQSLQPELRRVDLSELAGTPVQEQLLHRYLLPPASRWDWLPSGTAGPSWVSEEIVPPRKLHAPQPGYTSAARRHRTRGRVTVESYIGTDGRVNRAQVLHGLPHGLNERAVDAVCSWRFKPATRDGEPLEIRYTLMLNFSPR